MRIITQVTNHENKKRTKIKFESFLVLVFVLTLVVVSSVCAQQSAGVLLQSGLYKENVNGELEAAIAIYERILKEFPKDRPVAAKALLHIGLCYEQLGKNEARKAYNQLVQDYADQTGEVAEARSRLSALDRVATAAAPSEGVTVRQVWSNWRVGGVGAVSPSGRYLALVDWNTNFDLVIRELVTGTERTLAVAPSQDPSEWEGVVGESMIFSSDSSRIAYTWYNSKDGGVDLRIVSLDEPKPRILYSAGGSGNQVYPLAWSPNGNDILAAFYSRGEDGSRLGLVSVSDGSLRILESLTGDKAAHVAGFSSDGKYILYSSPQEKDSPNSDVFLHALDTGANSRLVEHPANDVAAGWAPDGSRVLFASDRRGTRDAWLIQVLDGKPQGEPQLIKSDLGRVKPLGFTQSGSYYYTKFSTVSDIYIATLDVEAGKVVEPQKKVSLQREGSSKYADWSPDGKHLAYISQGPGATHDDARIVVLTLETGEYRELSTSLRFVGEKGARWSPDGRSFVLWGGKDQDKPSTWGIYRIDAQTGEDSLIKQGRFPQPEWTPDGQGIVYAKVEAKDESSILASTSMLCHFLMQDLKTGEEKELAVVPVGEFVPAFALSADGRELAFTVFDRDAESEFVVLKVVPVAGGKQRELTRLQLPDKIGQIEWTPDGKWVLFERRSKEKTAIWRIPAEGGTAQAFDLVPTGYSRGSLFPCMHPDGRRIAFTGGNTWAGDVWVMENFLPKPEPRPSNGPSVRQVWKDPKAGGTWAVSPNGQCLAFVDYATMDLAIRELATGADRRITKTGGWREGSYVGVVEGCMAFSPDGKWIAYNWLQQNDVDLRIVDLDASEPRILCRGESGKVTWPIAWSPNGKEILAAFPDGQYGLVSVPDGLVRILESLTKDTIIGETACFSPDGRYIVCNSPQEKGSSNADISLFALETGAHSRLVEHPANDILLGWTLDGSSVLFASDRRGTLDAWLVQVADGKRQGEPRLIKADLGQIIPLGFTQNGAFYYGVSSVVGDVYVATLDLETGRVVEPPKKVSLRREGLSSSPDWSANGKYLAYISQRFGSIPDHATIVIHNVETGEYRELSTSLRNIRLKGARWSPDGRSFIVYGYKGASAGGGGIYQVDAQTGRESLIKKVWAGQPEWTPDGKGIVFVQGGNSGTNRIMLRDLETGQERELAVASRGAMEQMFALSPDGRQLAFTTVRKDTESVVLNAVPVAGGEPRELTRVKLPEKIGRLEWVPDGSQVLFEKQVEEGTALWRVPVEGGAAQASGLVARGWGGAGGYLFPRMHPDGRRIAFTGGSPTVGEVWVMENFLPMAEAEN